MSAKVEKTPNLPKPQGISLATLNASLLSFATSLQQFLTRLATRANDTLSRNGTEVMEGPLYLRSYLKTELPDATLVGGMIYVSNEAGGATVAFSDGSDWRRVQDRAVVS